MKLLFYCVRDGADDSVIKKAKFFSLGLWRQPTLLSLQSNNDLYSALFSASVNTATMITMATRV